MASIIRIKRSSVSGNPGTLGAGELAYSALADNGSNGGDRLYIGMGTESAGNAANHIVIGGKFFTDRLDHAAGTLTASSAIIVDSNSKIDTLLTTNLQLGGTGYDNYIRSTNTDGNIVLSPNGDGYVAITGTNALVIPKGTSAQQAPQLAGAIRFNTDNTAFEGYDGTNWSSLGGVKSVDQNTYVTASNNGDIDFYSDTVNVATVNGDGLDIKATTATTSDGTTGALKVAGGASIQGNLFVGGNLYGIDEVSSSSYLAANGVPNNGTTGFSFQDDSGYDTGMFSVSDGQLSLYSNGDEILYLNGTSDSYLKTPTLHLGTNYGTITATTDEIVINPNSDNDYSRLHIASWLINGNTNLYNNGNAGLTLGNADNGDSSIDIGGSSTSWYSGNADDISLFAQRNGVINLRTNNGDINLQNDYGNITFRNSDGHLVIPGVIETNDTTGDVVLASSNGTEKNLVFKQDGSLTLPNVGINFFDSNNISGTQVAALDFDGGDLYIDAFNGNFSIWSYDSSQWQFISDSNGSYMSLPTGAVLYHDASRSLTLGYNVESTGSAANRITLGTYTSTTQHDQGQYAIAIGTDAGTENQAASTIAIGHLAGQISQGWKSVAIGEGAGQTSQAQWAVALGLNAGNDTQGNSTVAIGHSAGRTSQGSEAVAIGVCAGQTSQGAYAVALGARAGYGGTTSQGQYSIAIGYHAGYSDQHDNSIALNASGSNLDPSEAGLYIDPIRNVNSGSQFVIYNSDTKEVTYNATNIEITGSTIAATNAGTDANVVLEPIGAGYVSVSNAQIKHVAEPTDDTDAATKYYVDAARSGLDVKASVRLATTEDIALTGVQTIDTKTTTTGDRILVKDQDLAKNNGIYVANDAGAWTRATDFDNLANDLTTPLAGEVTGGAFTFVEDGSINLNAGFVLTNKGEPVLGTDALNWTLFSASGTLIAGDGLSKSGYTLAVNVDTNGGIEINSDNLRLKSSLAGDGLTYDSGTLTIGGTTDRITIGTHTVDIASTYVGQTSITTLGTITSGTWNADTLGSGYGGTGFSTYAKGDLLYASDTNTLSKLTAGDTGKVLQVSASGVPTWGDIDGGTY